MEIAVTSDEAAFLDSAMRRLGAVAQAVAAIPPRGYFDIGSTWGKQFDPIYDELDRLRQEGYAALPENSEARKAFTSAMGEVIRQVGRAQNAEAGALESLVAILNDPLPFAWRLAKAEAEGAGALASDAASAASKAASSAFDSLASNFKQYALYGLGALALLAFAYGRGRRA